MKRRSDRSKRQGCRHSSGAAADTPHSCSERVGPTKDTAGREQWAGPLVSVVPRLARQSAEWDGWAAALQWAVDKRCVHGRVHGKHSCGRLASR